MRGRLTCVGSVCLIYETGEDSGVIKSSIYRAYVNRWRTSEKRDIRRTLRERDIDRRERASVTSPVCPGRATHGGQAWNVPETWRHFPNL
jgi:hypothetical protein